MKYSSSTFYSYYASILIIVTRYLSKLVHPSHQYIPTVTISSLPATKSDPKQKQHSITWYLHRYQTNRGKPYRNVPKRTQTPVFPTIVLR